MEKPAISDTGMQWHQITSHPLTAATILALLCLVLHHSALSAGWRFDDGPHLFFTATYSPWQYFFIPDIMREQSWAHITPWNAFFYELGLPFFGLNPTEHYAHLLFIIWAAAIATFLLLRLWFTPMASFMGAALFLSMPATGTVGQLLMTGHYAYGLLFTILAFYFFARGLRENNPFLSAAAAGVYALACLSKELYVPIIAILIFYPGGSWKKRLRHLWPALLVAIAYAAVRLQVLQGIGGYGRPPLSGQLTLSEVLTGFFSSLFGNGWIAGFIVTYCVISLLIAKSQHQQKINILFLSSIAITVATPILPMLQTGFADILSSRLLFFLSWVLAMGLVWLTHSKPTHVITLIAVAAALIFSQQQTIAMIASNSNILEKQNQFLIENESDGFFLPFQFKDLNYLSLIQQANLIITGRHSPTLIRSDKELITLSERGNSTLYAYDDHSHYVRPLTDSQLQEITNHLRQQLSASSNQSLGIHVAVESQGRRKILQWKFSGPPGHFLLHIRDYGMLTLPASGTMSYGMDIAGPAKKETQAYVYLVSPEGWIARSPDFTINPSINNAFTWSGRSATID